MTLWTVVLSLVAGWLAGGLANWAADVLPAWSQAPVPGTQRSGTARPSLALRPDDWMPWRRQPQPGRGQSGTIRGWLVVVAMVALFAVVVAWYAGNPLRVAIGWSYTLFLLTVLVIDFEHRRVLNVMLGPALPIILLISAGTGMPGVVSSLLGGLAGFGLFVLIALISRGAMGAGDVKLAGVIGLMTGFPAVLQALLLGIMIGGAAALLLLLVKRTGLKSHMAYAPYMVIGALIVLLGTLGG